VTYSLRFWNDKLRVVKFSACFYKISLILKICELLK
jgi:hypothetical protein